MAKGIMLRCEATNALAVENISATPMAKASEVSLTRVMISLPIAGKMRFATWGITMRANVCMRE